jgi:hypothetical protein
MTKTVRTVYVCHDEDSLRQRKGSTADQIERLHVVSATDSTHGLPYAKREHYPGSNQGNMIGHVVLPPTESLWSMSCRSKYPLFGPFRVECGGKTKGEEAPPGRGTKRKTLDDVEPVFWNSRPPLLLAEILKSFNMVAVIDLAVGDGELARQCALARVPYAGFCLTEIHAKAVRRHCIKTMLTATFTPGNDHYDPSLAMLMKRSAKLDGNAGEPKKQRKGEEKKTPPEEEQEEGEPKHKKMTEEETDSNEALKAFKQKMEELARPSK